MISPLLLALWAAPAWVSVSEAADAAVRLVERELGAPVDLAVRLECAPELRGLERLLGGLLVHRLERLWPEQGPARLLESGGGAPEARAQGAGWMLTLEVSRAGPRGLELRAELSRVDAGLWWPETPPLVAGAERLRVRLDEEAQGWLKAPSPPPALGLSAPEPWLALDEPVLDLAGCELDASHAGEELVVLFPDRVRIYHLGERGPVPWIQQALGGAPPAERLRVPRGRVLCREDAPTGAELWLGTTDRAEGYRFTLDRLRGALVEAQRLPGLPLAASSEGVPVLAAPDPNTGGYRLLSSGRPVLDLVATKAGPLELVTPGIWRPLGAAPDSPALARGGLGGTSSGARDPGWVTTSSVAWRGPDHLSLRRADGAAVGRGVRVPGPVRASTFVDGPGAETFLLIAVGAAVEPKSTLMRVSLALREDPRP